MARPKRKRTREDIEKELRENERVNATPCGPEDRADKRKRQRRRSSRRCNLNKALEALTLNTDHITTREVQAPAVDTSGDQEGKQEEDDPAEHQRRYAESVGEIVPVTVATPAPSAVIPEPDEAERIRAKKAEDARKRRANMTASQKERTRTRNRELQRIRRARKKTDQVQTRREHDRLYQEARRENLTEVARAEVRERDRIYQEGRRGDLSHDDREQERERDRMYRLNRRNCQSQEEKESERERDRIYQEARRYDETEEERTSRQEEARASQEARRSLLTEGEREAEGERNRIDHEVRRILQGNHEREAALERDTLRRRQRHDAQTEAQRAERREAENENRRVRNRCPRRGHALCNHESFCKSKVSGKNVEDGRHKLPDQIQCAWCGAWKWPGESAFSCCLKGKVQLPGLKAAPNYLHGFYREQEFREHIRAYNQVFAFTSIGASRSDSSAIQRVREDTSVQGQRGVYTYRIQGAMGHYLGSLLPSIDYFDTSQPAPAKFAQIYIVDPDMHKRAARREGIFAHLDREKLGTLEHMMATINPFGQQFLNFGELLRKEVADGKEIVDLQFNLYADRRRPGTTNLPTVSEVGATLVEDGNLDKHRDLIIYTKQRRLLRLFETNPMYDPLQYPLLFPSGELGWSFTDTYANGQTRREEPKMSLREFTAFRLFPKPGDGSVLHLGGRLFQQWCVDQRAKVEQDSLRWVANNQKEIRADLYRGVEDAYINESAVEMRDEESHAGSGGRQQKHFLNQYGLRRILPATYTGSPRYMYKCYKDSMTIVAEYGKPDIFMTMTCNPEWSEITSELTEGQTAQDRPDIVARVWNQKLRELLADLDAGVLGSVRARIYVVEFQKRGLPHAHILIILDDQDKPRCREVIDAMVSAEIPDEATNPDLYKTVMTCMMHGPCGAANPNCACMKDGKCSKGFPKKLNTATQADVNGYPEYKRRERSAGVLKFKGRKYDNATANKWVVPYNPHFSQKYDCHINVEVCTGITAVKYIYKYVYKGSDRTVMTIVVVDSGNGRPSEQRLSEEPNEILRYLDARYISPVEACIRLLNYAVQGKTHSVVQLTVHLEREHMVHFDVREDPTAILERSAHTHLTRFFELCQSDAAENQIAKTMLYKDIPKEFVWNEKQWVRRKQYRAALGRLVHVSPRDGEKFFLRILLCNRRGPTSFEDIRTVNGVVCPTFRDAALQLGYLDNDQEWVACMTEAASFQMPYQLRQLFSTLLVYSMPSDVRGLWDQFYEELNRDIAHKHRDLPESTRETVVMFETLKSVNDLLKVSGYAVTDFDLPQLSDFPSLVRESLLDDNLIRREKSYSTRTLEAIVRDEAKLNEGQKAVFDQIIQAVEAESGHEVSTASASRNDGGRSSTREVSQKLFFVDGPGGTGKSTLLRHILARVRLDGKIALAVASSGIASLLLMGGRTAHSAFKIPLKLDKGSTCSIFKQSHLRKLIQQTSLVIWDEAPMTHRHAFEAVDRTLRDIMDNPREPFGGKVFVLSGDFRQILPVVKRGTPAETINACIKESPLWRHFLQVRLTQNMRIGSEGTGESDEDILSFSEFLLAVGEGRHEKRADLGNDYIKIPADMLIPNPPVEDDEDEEIVPGAIPRGMTRIIDAMYADVTNPEVATNEYFASRTILTTTNETVRRINEAVAARLPETARECLSVDSVEDDDGTFFEQEFLHSVNMNGIPPHRLLLKKGIPIMMMRNLNPDLGLCNGTRLRIVDLKDHVIRATIVTGERTGQEVLIPRIMFVSDDDSSDFPFRLRRKQFPVQPAFAMTINKAQGQTVLNLGLYLASPCFSHGQLYVALSRVTSRSKFKALIEYPEFVDPDGGVYTRNIVYTQIFD